MPVHNLLPDPVAKDGVNNSKVHSGSGMGENIRFDGTGGFSNSVKACVEMRILKVKLLDSAFGRCELK